jgi:hypothetical protein
VKPAADTTSAGLTGIVLEVNATVVGVPPTEGLLVVLAVVEEVGGTTKRLVALLLIELSEFTVFETIIEKSVIGQGILRNHLPIITLAVVEVCTTVTEDVGIVAVVTPGILEIETGVDKEPTVATEAGVV